MIKNNISTLFLFFLILYTIQSFSAILEITSLNNKTNRTLQLKSRKTNGVIAEFEPETNYIKIKVLLGLENLGKGWAFVDKNTSENLIFIAGMYTENNMYFILYDTKKKINEIKFDNIPAESWKRNAQFDISLMIQENAPNNFSQSFIDVNALIENKPKPPIKKNIEELSTSEWELEEFYR